MSIWLPKNSGNLHCRFMMDGEWYRTSTGTDDIKKAKQVEKEFRQQVINSGGKKNISIIDALNQFAETKKDLSDYANTTRHVTVLAESFGKRKVLSSLTTRDITKFVNSHKRKYSNATVRHRLQTLRSAVKHARGNGYLVPNLEYPKLKLRRGRTRVLSNEEIQAIENELHPDLQFGNYYISDESKRFRQDAYDMWIIFCGTGARFTEISGLEWSQVNLTNRNILLYRPKVDNESVLVMTDRVYDVLKRRAYNPLSRTFVFPNKKGEARGYTGDAIKKAIKRAGLGSDVTPHVVRHTVATRLLEAGLNIQEVQHLLGHASSQTTQRYLHASTQHSATRAADVLNTYNKTEQPKLSVVRRK